MPKSLIALRIDFLHLDLGEKFGMAVSGERDLWIRTSPFPPWRGHGNRTPAFQCVCLRFHASRVALANAQEELGGTKV